MASEIAWLTTELMTTYADLNYDEEAGYSHVLVYYSLGRVKVAKCD